MFLRLIFILCLLTGTAFSAPPNIVMIISDDHAWTDYGFMGHPHIKTPHLDKLAGQSLTFRKGYVTSSLCCPSLATILTGQYPHRHRITSNDPPWHGGPAGQPKLKDPEFIAGRERMNTFMDAAPGLPRLLGARGYVSMQTGKWWQGNFKRGGFTEGMTTGETESGGRHGDAGLAIGRKTMQPVYDFIGRARKEAKPFFLWYAPMMPHDPHTPPERLLAKYWDLAPTLHVARYWAMVEWFDETCGQLLTHLDEQGLSENTIVVYVADNGWIQDPEKARYAPRSKQSQYDGGLRTPIMLRWPARLKPSQPAAPASSVDLAPTLLRACGIEPPKEMSGVDLLDEKAVAARDAVFGACFTHDAVDLDAPARSLRWRWCVAGNLKLIVPGAAEPTAPVELYDLAADPHEKQNLAESRKADGKRLRERMDAWWNGRD
jgi:arylsulfatase A-like enzyme